MSYFSFMCCCCANAYPALCHMHRLWSHSILYAHQLLRGTCTTENLAGAMCCNAWSSVCLLSTQCREKRADVLLNALSHQNRNWEDMTKIRGYCCPCITNSISHSYYNPLTVIFWAFGLYPSSTVKWPSRI